MLQQKVLINRTQGSGVSGEGTEGWGVRWGEDTSVEVSGGDGKERGE